ncbi:dihydrolipoamide dehydrogenase [Thalassospira profundimaris]|uniref:Dihydrolipoamide dehydrogenase n=1 Tax=Thalassospira profundimaris TaxID=502049 RepID=A0A367WL24_9PROT|nr:FAD-dependent oxidoreductase [Thalassospira profundimaris]RCK41919.1 dihydrolipoamide dehydrogenase [Thalassospira profundimaris]
MTSHIDTDICIIGGGSAGLSVAAGAVQMGARVVLVEKGRMGGDCLNTGCVPSKALLAAAHHAHAITRSPEFGLHTSPPDIDFAAVMAHVRDVIAGIAPHDSVERFERLGCTVINDQARFTGPKTLVAGGTTVRAKRFVIATGSHAAIPPIPGLLDVPFLTNETIFDNNTRPRHLIIVGGGPIGIEMAQAHKRLGARVTVTEQGRILPKDDPELVAIARQTLENEGVSLYENAMAKQVVRHGTDYRLTMMHKGAELTLEGSHLLIATGRHANIEDLGLDEAGVACRNGAIQVDARLRTSNKRIFAIGDVTGGLQFTHMASYDAGIVIRNALFRLPAKVNYRAVPWVTYMDPEIAQVGLNEDAARKAHGNCIRTASWHYADNDRARTERRTDGLIKIVTTSSGRILGAGIAGPQAGELIGLWSLAIDRKLKIGAVAGHIAPYPTLGEISKRVAGAWYTPSLFSKKTRKIVRFLLALG